MDLVQIFLYFWLQIDLIGKKAAKTLAVWWEKYECEYWQGEEEDANVWILSFYQIYQDAIVLQGDLSIQNCYGFTKSTFMLSQLAWFAKYL